MSFEVLLHRVVRKSIKNLPNAHQRQISELIEVLKENPIPFKEFDVVRVGGYEGMFRIRFGEFRLTYEIDENNRRIKLLKLEPRGKAYKGL